jgi:hypothetical protein
MLRDVMNLLSRIDDFKKIAFILIKNDLQSVKNILNIEDENRLYCYMVDDELDYKQIVFEMVSYNLSLLYDVLFDILIDDIYPKSKLEQLIIDEFGDTLRDNKIKAIKLHRDKTNSSLKEAKDYIEGLIDKQERVRIK